MDSGQTRIEHDLREASRLAPGRSIALAESSVPHERLRWRDLTLLDTFDSHGLEDLDRAELMQRVDTKFALPRSRLPTLLRDMRPHYSALEIDGLRRFRYRNDYYDDPGYGFYVAHHVGRANRHKVRRRDYLDSGIAFVEVKFKDNRGRTTKTRVPVDGEDRRLDASALALLDAAGIVCGDALAVVQCGHYRRAALANETRGERLTIDCALTFSRPDGSHRRRLGAWVLLELKQARLDRSSPFFVWARAQRLRPGGFSKYCMGVYATGPDALPRNRFHATARRVGLRDHRVDRDAERCARLHPFTDLSPRHDPR